MRAIDSDELREYWLYNGLNERVYDTNDVVNGKIEKTSQLANDVMTRFHQKHPEFYAVQECPSCGRMCLYNVVLGVLDDPTRIKYKCGACNREFERETGYWRRY